MNKLIKIDYETILRYDPEDIIAQYCKDNMLDEYEVDGLAILEKLREDYPDEKIKQMSLTDAGKIVWCQWHLLYIATLKLMYKIGSDDARARVMEIAKLYRLRLEHYLKNRKHYVKDQTIYTLEQDAENKELKALIPDMNLDMKEFSLGDDFKSDLIDESKEIEELKKMRLELMAKTATTGMIEDTPHNTMWFVLAAIKKTGKQKLTDADIKNVRPENLILGLTHLAAEGFIRIYQENLFKPIEIEVIK